LEHEVRRPLQKFASEKRPTILDPAYLMFVFAKEHGQPKDAACKPLPGLRSQPSKKKVTGVCRKHIKRAHSARPFFSAHPKELQRYTKEQAKVTL
jgi:hypothetical protein